MKLFFDVTEIVFAIIGIYACISVSIIAFKDWHDFKDE
jgi:hypothetical protein